jgi:hypothetical protein
MKVRRSGAALRRPRLRKPDWMREKSIACRVEEGLADGCRAEGRRRRFGGGVRFRDPRTFRHER